MGISAKIIDVESHRGDDQSVGSAFELLNGRQCMRQRVGVQREQGVVLDPLLILNEHLGQIVDVAAMIVLEMRVDFLETNPHDASALVGGLESVAAMFEAEVVSLMDQAGDLAGDAALD